MLPEFNGSVVHRVGLYRQVNRHFWPLFAHHHDQTWVSHDECVGFEVDYGFDVAHIGADFIVVGQQVAGDKQFFATGMGFLNALL